MKRPHLNVFTIALDAMPWLAVIFAALSKVEDVPWKWVIVEGAAMNVKDTRWCAPQQPRLSCDGTTAFLDTLGHHPRIEVIRKPRWEGKVEMCNAALERFDQPGVLLQNDADEVWTADQYRSIAEMFEDDSVAGAARFTCRYFVGPNIITTDHVDWWRAWRFEPGDRFKTHEPPTLSVCRGYPVSRQYTAQVGLVFDHYSWALPEQVAYKEKFYGKKYAGALSGWKRLQAHQLFPTPVQAFFPWSAPATLVDQVFSEPSHAPAQT